MKEYAAYFDSATKTWKVIAKDEDGFWFNHIPDAGGQETAQDVAEAMNEQSRRFLEGVDNGR